MTLLAAHLTLTAVLTGVLSVVMAVQHVRGRLEARRARPVAVLPELGRIAAPRLPEVTARAA